VARRGADRLDPRGIADVFDKCDVETIAPGYGCILHGRKVVARHVEMLDEILKGLDKSVRCRATSTAMRSAEHGQQMPREIAPGVFWIGDCLAQRHKGQGLSRL